MSFFSDTFRWKTVAALTIALALSLIVAPRSALADEDAEFRRARAAAAAGDLLEARSLLEDFIETYPKGENTLRARYILGRLLYRHADHAGAAAEFAEIMEIHPAWGHAGKAAYGLAMAQLGMLDYGATARTLQMMLASYPESEYASDALYWLGADWHGGQACPLYSVCSRLETAQGFRLSYFF